jgi:hypothetical protein
MHLDNKHILSKTFELLTYVLKIALIIYVA